MGFWTHLIRRKCYLPLKLTSNIYLCFFFKQITKKQINCNLFVLTCLRAEVTVKKLETKISISNLQQKYLENVISIGLPTIFKIKEDNVWSFSNGWDEEIWKKSHIPTSLKNIHCNFCLIFKCSVVENHMKPFNFLKIDQLMSSIKNGIWHQRTWNIWNW